MIKYKLICKACNIKFDSWFATSIEYDKLKKRKFLTCYNCNSSNVEKGLMAPKLINSKNITENKILDKKHSRINKTIKRYQKFIKNNFKFVGDDFAFEARSIHYNPKKKSKPIYGSASKKDLKELKEEGIVTKLIPWIDDSNN